MDSLTHIVLGGCIAEAMAGKKVGRRTIFLGAAAQSLPDIDFLSSFWLSPANDLLAHRGFTHSILFALLSAFILALLADKYMKAKGLSLRAWVLFFSVQILVHIFLDAFNNYGVGWFEPFTHTRVSFNILFVADPFLSLPLAIGFVHLFLTPQKNTKRTAMAWMAIAWCVAYLSYGLMHKVSIDSNVRRNLQEQGISTDAYFSTPTALNNWLWYVVANSDSGSYIGYRSVFDSGEKIDFEYFNRSEYLLDSLHENEDFQHLLRFSQGFYTAEMWGDTLVFNDLRFGQMIGWRDRRARFVFHYFLEHPDGNELVVQRGRFAGWDPDAALSLVKRIRGE